MAGGLSGTDINVETYEGKEKFRLGSDLTRLSFENVLATSDSSASKQSNDWTRVAAIWKALGKVKKGQIGG